MTLRDELHDAAARRAVILDRQAMGDPCASCMASRARALIAAGLVAAGALYLLTRTKGKH